MPVISSIRPSLPYSLTSRELRDSRFSTGSQLFDKCPSCLPFQSECLLLLVKLLQSRAETNGERKGRSSISESRFLVPFLRPPYLPPFPPAFSPRAIEELVLRKHQASRPLRRSLLVASGTGSTLTGRNKGARMMNAFMEKLAGLNMDGFVSSKKMPGARRDRPTKRVARHEDGGEAEKIEGEKRGKRGGEEDRPDLHG